MHNYSVEHYLQDLSSTCDQTLKNIEHLFNRQDDSILQTHIKICIRRRRWLQGENVVEGDHEHAWFVIVNFNNLYKLQF